MGEIATIQQAAVEMYASGKSSIQVAKALGVSKATVLRSVRAAGVVRPLREAFRISQRTFPKGDQCHQWKGGRKISGGGYVFLLVPEHPSADMHGYVAEHRVVMEGILGRCLPSHEHVHHKNEDKADNRPENLELLSRSAHMSKHANERERHAEGHFGKHGRKQK